MIELQQRMDVLYYQNIEAYASKNKIQISLPNKEIIKIDTDTEPKYSDEYIYHKPWNKLNNIHKNIKIKEFINNLISDDIEMKNKLKQSLADMIKEKKLSKKTDVNYDSNLGCIISIPILQYSDHKYVICV